MASGVEMLGQMSETQALAGPVQGGNMVVKPNEVPVGGAAMLAKALRGQANKGIGGIYELPSQKAPTPEFMQMAKAGLQQGDPMRGMGPRKGLTAYDMANMAGAVEQAGIINFLGEQPEVTAPIRAKSHADAPPTQLAYITDAEKQMLLDANMHGSLEGNQPNQGPAGIQSLDDFYNTPGGGVGGGSGQNVFDSGVDNTGSSSNIDAGGSGGGGQGNSGGYQSSEAYGIDSGMAVGGSDDGTVFNFQAGEGNQPGKFLKDEEETKKLAAEAEQKQQDLLQKLAAKSKKSKEQIQAEDRRNTLLNQDDETMSKEDRAELTKLNRQIAEFNAALADDDGGILEGAFDKGKKFTKEQIEKLKGLGLFDDLLSGGTFGTIMDMISKPTKESFLDNNYKAIMKDKYFNADGTFKEGMEKDFDRFTKEYDSLMEESGAINPNEDILSMEDVIKSGKVPEGSDLERRLNPNKYWSENKPVSSLDFKDMAEAQAFGKLDFTKGNTLAIQQGRELLARERGGNQNNRPRFMQETQEEVVETPDGVIDEEAQTMKFTSPRTGDKEVNVPLNRRFRTDPTKDVAQYSTTPRTESDIYKYMTEGTTGEGIGLEPFSEYQRRRRKAMGLDPLELYG